MTPRGWALLAGTLVLAAAFSFANRFERVALNLGIVRIGSLPLPLLFFAAVLLGMGAMLLLSLPQDRRTREALRERGLLEVDPPRPVEAPRPREVTEHLPG